MTNSFQCNGYRKLTIDDIELVNKYLRLANYTESNHNIVNMIMWMDFFPLWIKVSEKYISIVGKHLGRHFLYMPLCKKEDFMSAIDDAIECFRASSIPIYMSCFLEVEALMVKEKYPELQLIDDRDGYDYIYLTESFATFAGKKLQKKRNHLNAFYKEYGSCYQYERITSDNIQECNDLLESWAVDKLEDEFAHQEYQGVKTVMAFWDKLPTWGGMIRINGKVEAFIIGSQLNQDMAQINIEKANANIRGLYQAILKEFTLDRLMDYTYLNREDDIGLDSLRQAKLTYNPLMFQKKYRIEGN